MKFYYVPNASSLAVHIALEWAGADYEPIKTEFGSQILKDLNPIGTAGVIKFKDGFVLAQVPALLKYLTSLYPDADMGSDPDPRACAEMDRWLSFLVSDVHHAFHLLFNPSRYAIEENNGARDAALMLCYRNFKVLDTHLSSTQFMLGQKKSILDSYLLPMVRWSYVIFPEDKKDFTHLNAHHDMMLKDEAVITAMEQEGIWDSIQR